MLSERYVKNRAEFLSQNEFQPRLAVYIRESLQMIRSYPIQFIGLTVVYFLFFSVPVLLYESILGEAIYMDSTYDESTLYDAIYVGFAYFACLIVFFTIVALYNAAHLAKVGVKPSLRAMFNFKGKFFSIFLVLFVPFVSWIFGSYFFQIPDEYMALSLVLLVLSGVSFCFTAIFYIPLFLFTDLKGLEVLQTSFKMIYRSWFNILLFFIATVVIWRLVTLANKLEIFGIYPESFVFYFLLICYYLCFSDMMDLQGGEDPSETIGRGVEYRDENAEVL